MIQRAHRHPETKQELNSPVLSTGNLVTKANIPQAIGLDEVADPEAFNLQVIQILTDIPGGQEGGN